MSLANDKRAPEICVEKDALDVYLLSSASLKLSIPFNILSKCGTVKTELHLSKDFPLTVFLFYVSNATKISHPNVLILTSKGVDTCTLK